MATARNGGLTTRWWNGLDWRKCRWSTGDGWVYDEERELVTLNGVPIERAHPLVLRILSLMLRAAGRPISKQDLSEAIWAGGTVADSAIEKGISRVRDVLGPHRKRLKNVYGGSWWLDLTQEPVFVCEILEPIDLRPGLVIPNRPDFELVKPLGPPGSTVWLGHSVFRGELPRVFRFAQSPQRLASLRREHAQYQVLKRFLGTHSGIVLLHRWDLERPPCHLELDYCGDDLGAWIAQRHPLPERVQVCADMFRMLAAAHEHAVLHGGLKPGNVLIAAAPARWHVRLADWGSHLIGAAVLAPGAERRLDMPRIASRDDALNEVPPEIRRNPRSPATRQADVYAAAVLAAQLLAEDPALSVDPGWETRIRHHALRQIIYSAAHQDPSQRPTAAQIAAAFESWPDEPGAPPGPRQRLRL